MLIVSCTLPQKKIKLIPVRYYVVDYWIVLLIILKFSLYEQITTEELVIRIHCRKESVQGCFTKTEDTRAWEARRNLRLILITVDTDLHPAGRTQEAIPGDLVS